MVFKTWLVDSVIEYVHNSTHLALGDNGIRSVTFGHHIYLHMRLSEIPVSRCWPQPLKMRSNLELQIPYHTGEYPEECMAIHWTGINIISISQKFGHSNLMSRTKFCTNIHYPQWLS